MQRPITVVFYEQYTSGTRATQYTCKCDASAAAFNRLTRGYTTQRRRNFTDILLFFCTVDADDGKVLAVASGGFKSGVRQHFGFPVSENENGDKVTDKIKIICENCNRPSVVY